MEAGEGGDLSKQEIISSSHRVLWGRHSNYAVIQVSLSKVRPGLVTITNVNIFVFLNFI